MSRASGPYLRDRKKSEIISNIYGKKISPEAFHYLRILEIHGHGGKAEAGTDDLALHRIACAAGGDAEAHLRDPDKWIHPQPSTFQLPRQVVHLRRDDIVDRT